VSDPFGGLPAPPPAPEPKRPFLPATYGLLAAMGVFFLAELYVAGDASGESTVALMRLGALFPPAVRDGDFWRLGSYAFLHIGWMHLFFNCWAIWVVLPQLELAFGSNLALGFFCATALAGGAASYGWETFRGHALLAAGASGGAFGLMGAMVALLFRVRHRFSKEARASLTRQIVFNLLINVGIAFSFPVDNAAHLGGLACGLILGGLAPQRSLPRRFWQSPAKWTTLASILVLGSLQGAAVGRAVKPKPRVLRGPGVVAQVDPLFVQIKPGIAEFPGAARIVIEHTEQPPAPEADDERVRIAGRDWLRQRAVQKGQEVQQLATSEGEGSLLVGLACADPGCRGERGDRLLELTARTVRSAP
jgi:rhomboid protease GluP